MKNIFFLLSVVFVFWGCDIKKPTVEASFATVGFRHTGTETTCVTCHLQNRPAAINGFSHYNNNDCVSCHIAGGLWTTHTFHAQNSNPVSCSSCHEKDRKAAVLGVPHGNGDDCVGCHTVSNSWATGASPHNPLPTSCTSCHTADRPAPVNGQPHYNNGDCVTCHVAGGLWASYKLYGHTPLPTSCNQCHENKRPALSNHPSQNTAAVTDKRHYVTKDCYACHKTPTTTPRLFKFAHTNAANAKIGFCLPCHYNKGWTKHSGSPSYFVGDGTCFNCHNQGKSWNAN